MNGWLTERRLADPDFIFARDGIHPDANGHWIMAQAILLHLGASDVAKANGVVEMLAVHPRGGETLKLIREKQPLLRDAWLTDTGHTRPGLKEGVPLSEAQARATELDRQIRHLAKAASTNSAPLPGRRS